MARLLLAHGADPNASVYTAGSATAAAYNGGSPRTHAPDQAMIDLLVSMIPMPTKSPGPYRSPPSWRPAPP
jgi:hypothetical protein